MNCRHVIPGFAPRQPVNLGCMEWCTILAYDHCRPEYWSCIAFIGAPTTIPSNGYAYIVVAHCMSYLLPHTYEEDSEAR